MLAESLISANLDYASHPTFQQLLKAGVRGTTISGWFKEIMNVGVDPFENKETFLFEMGKIIRNAITIDEPRVAQPNMVFVGASGAGKTTMIMKLVEHPDFFAQKRVAIVSVIPRNSHQKYSILEPFSRDHNLDYYQVKDGIDVSKLMKKLVEYDHVLFDTPSISLEKETAFREYWKIRQILASVMPLEVHFVVNASMEQFYFRETYAANHPLQPDYVAITHLDETQRWGHLIPFLKTLGCGVRYLSMGTQVPDDVHAFSPTWFAEQILSRAN
jgi:flagellar biosynthesis GTPase FlhF